MRAKDVIAGCALSLLSVPFAARLAAGVASNRLVILMLHRFAKLSHHARGHSPAELRSTLSLLRASGVRLLPLDSALSEFFEESAQRLDKKPAVAFTVDDGYDDFLEVALPVFEEFDCPVTCFVVPDVIDGKTWFWWDRLDFVLRRLPADSMPLVVEGEDFELRRSTGEYSWKRPLVNMLKGRTEQFRSLFLAELEERSGVVLPEKAPEEYRVMTWDAIRQCERRGVRFGAHSLSHPVLSQVGEEAVTQEILGSVRRLGEEVQSPSSVFCYPYGLSSDFSSREVAILRTAGVRFAVSALPGTVRPKGRGKSTDAELHWRIPRFSFDGRPGMALRQLLFP